MPVAYSSLTATQKTLCEHAAAVFRSELGRFQISLNHLQACLNEYNGNGVGTILATVTSTETVPNSTALAGTGDVLVSDVTAMATSIQTALTTYNTVGNQQTYAHWAGSPNVIG